MLLSRLELITAMKILLVVFFPLFRGSISPLALPDNQLGRAIISAYAVEPLGLIPDQRCIPGADVSRTRLCRVFFVVILLFFFSPWTHETGTRHRLDQDRELVLERREAESRRRKKALADGSEILIPPSGREK